MKDIYFNFGGLTAVPLDEDDNPEETADLLRSIIERAIQNSGLQARIVNEVNVSRI